MKLRKTLIVVSSLLGIYSTVRKYQKSKRPVRTKRRQVIAHPTNRYSTLTGDQVREEFKNRIAAGEWLSQDEYTQMTNAMRSK